MGAKRWKVEKREMQGCHRSQETEERATWQREVVVFLLMCALQPSVLLLLLSDGAREVVACRRFRVGGWGLQQT